MTYQEIKTVRTYDKQGLEAATKAAHMSAADVLHTVAKYRRSRRLPSPQCEGCSFATYGKPCVMPFGICELEAFRRKNGGWLGQKPRKISENK